MSMSTSSDNSTLDGFAVNRKLSIAAKSGMSIHIDNHFQSKVYTTSSPLSGHVRISMSRDMRFDNIQILLVGTSRTRVETSYSPHATSHTFLKLEMPLDPSSYPVPRVYEAGLTYNIPFNFVIPQHLTLSACRHNSDTDASHEYHLCLPPTMGAWEGKDDLSPNMARVDYKIQARVSRDEELSGERFKVMESSQPVKVLPSYSEQPPLNITKKDRLYTMSKSKTLRKSLLITKLGKVTVSAAQPSAAMMSPDGHSIARTDAMVDVNFEPASSELTPPKVTNISAKVAAVTYFSSGGINTLPNLGDWNRSFGADGRGSYSNSSSLFSTALGKKIKWKHNLTSQARRDSGSGSDSDHAKNKGSPVYYTTTLQVPINLPVSKKMFIPSFQSCISSRAYVLSVTVSFSAGGTSSSVTLALPLQVGVESIEADVDSTGLPTFETAIEEAAVDDYLRSRTLHAPRVEFARQELPGYADLLPGYADLMRERLVAAN